VVISTFMFEFMYVDVHVKTPEHQRLSSARAGFPPPHFLVIELSCLNIKVSLNHINLK
jgi:hypothetical protein